MCVPSHCCCFSALASLSEFVTTLVRFFTACATSCTVIFMPSWQKSKLTLSAPSRWRSLFTSASCHDDAPTGCSKANLRPSAACLRHKNTANEKCWIAASSSACTSADSRFSLVRFCSTLKAVHGGEATSRYGLSTSHLRSALRCVAARDRSQGMPSSSFVVRSIENPGT